MTPARQYPLQWPTGWPRTRKPIKSQFSTGLNKATMGLMEEIRILGARLPVISSNAQYRQDGMPYARQSNFDDSGVAVYFEYKGNPMVFACDRFLGLHENVHSIAKTIEALRSIERWGASDMMERAFTGFTSLPAPIVAGVKRPWREVMEYGSIIAHETYIQSAYRMLARKYHPDHGGDPAKMSELNVARDEALKEVKG